MRRQVVLSAYVGVAALLAIPGAAFAQQSVAYTNGPVNLRAGPAQDYPMVAQLPGGLQVTVMGCISDYSWCDVAMPNLRGWVYAGKLDYPYQGNNVPLLTYGTTIGVPIVTFAIGSYWGNYYRNRPWYQEQGRWANHPPPGHGYGRPPGNGRPPGPPPGHGNGGRPPGPPPGHGNGGRPPGPPPGQGNVGRPPGPPPGQGNVGRPPGPPPGQGNGGRPPGNGGGRPPGGGGGGGGRPSGPPPSHGGGNGGGDHGGGGGGHGNQQPPH
jgi:uncharacterized protein YraI